MIPAPPPRSAKRRCRSTAPPAISSRSRSACTTSPRCAWRWVTPRCQAADRREPRDRAADRLPRGRRLLPARGGTAGTGRRRPGHRHPDADRDGCAVRPARPGAARRRGPKPLQGRGIAAWNAGRGRLRPPGTAGRERRSRPDSERGAPAPLRRHGFARLVRTPPRTKTSAWVRGNGCRHRLPAAHEQRNDHRVSNDKVRRVEQQAEVEGADRHHRQHPADHAEHERGQGLRVRVCIGLGQHHHHGDAVRHDDADRRDGRISGEEPSGHARRRHGEQGEIQPARASTHPAARPAAG